MGAQAADVFGMACWDEDESGEQSLDRAGHARTLELGLCQLDNISDF